MRTLLLTTGFLALSQSALAQPANVVLSWEFSTDAGTTWVPDTIVVNSSAPTPVRVRGRMSWDNTDHTYFFSSVFFDAFVARRPGSGSSDSIETPLFLQQGFLDQRSAAAIIPVANILKIDQADDLELPGLGPRWLAANQIPQFLEYDTHNPVTFIQYDYTLDGTPGTRTISAALRESAQGSTAFFYSTFPPPVLTFATVHDGTITVIPAPTPLALAALAASLTTTRRRRR